MYRPPLFHAAVVCSILALTGLPGGAPHAGESFPEAPPGPLALTGALAYGAPIALPPDSVAAIELRSGGGPTGELLAHQRIPLWGRQVHRVPFALAVPRQRLAGGVAIFRGSIAVGGRARWVTDPVTVATGGAAVDLGTLTLSPSAQPAFASTLRCGDLAIRVGFEGQDAILAVGDETFRLSPTVAASGARFESPDDPGTSFWSKGDAATLSLRGRTYPECRPAPERPEGLRASGNEPGWRLDIEAETLRLRTQNGPLDLTAPRPAAEPGEGFVLYRAQLAGHTLAATVVERICVDTMTGLPYPMAVTLVLDGEALAGCGGDPASLLQGDAWAVEYIDGQGMVPGVRPSLSFNPDGSLAGNASCGPLRGAYRVGGEALSLSASAVAPLDCAAAPREQERRFLDILGQVRGFEIDPAGALILRTGDGRSITARRSARSA